MNRLKNCVLMAAGFAVLLITVGVSTAGHAIAQAVRAALVSNVDDPGRIPYASQARCAFSTGSTSCSIVFPPVPAGKRLVLTHVSGLITENLPGGTLILPRVFGGNSTYLLVTYQGGGAVYNYFVIDQQVLKFYDAGQTPAVGLELGAAPNAGSDGDFNLTGYMLDCTTATCAAIAQ
jgi:hypothetical protein